MGQILVRHLDDVTLQRLKQRAMTNNRSTEAEIRVILNEAVKPPMSARSLVSLAGSAPSGRSRKEIVDYVRALRDEWDR
ncbi:FitA-like ribbon-helix-helix domain-containing protein [Arvimicrobium flavum]|uniref:FitA-like ribbon-helix-helix domain-containing protein n=1 Tax=Arvimicrobium flavum TaxID=3393320 RepID=UPI00398CADB4